jgi:mono/diheme cytochrome c family protein/glucose/arabinose dehydrogenase/lysophospholipase L1-like esterase
MKTKFTLLTVPLVAAAYLSASAAESLHLTPKAGTANGKKIVFVSGDEEYRGEESHPMLAKILSQKHGFDCTVLFSLNPDGGYIDPNYQKSVSGTGAIPAADLMIISSRFRDLPEDQLANFAAFLNAGKPVIGFRTATHAFNGKATTGSFKWNEFGLKILGEKWVNHHGAHMKEGTRSVVETVNEKHPILTGVGEIFGDTDVYGVANLDANVAKILLRGQVCSGVDPASSGLTGPKNDPMMPLAWTFEYTAPNGTAKGKSFCTTMGSSTDFADEDLRRLIVNAAYHLTGINVPEKADVKAVDPFNPTKYQHIREKNFYKKRNLKPEDYVLGQSPATGVPGEAPAAAKAGNDHPHAPEAEPAAATKARSQAVAAPQKGERVVLLGNGLAERDTWYSRMETELQQRYPGQELIFRNMGHVGDTPGFRPHPSRQSQWAFPGAEKFHPDKKTHNGKGFYSTPDQWLTHLKADTIVAFFGFNESFDGPDKVANYEAELDAWVQHTLSKAYNGAEAPRLVLVSPLAFEDLSARRDLPNGAKENANLSLYAGAMDRVAKKHGLTYLDLFTKTSALYATLKQPFTDNGFMPTEENYTLLGQWVWDAVYGKQAPATGVDAKLLHQAVKQKDWFWNNDYNILNGVHTHGQRYKPYGPDNYPYEVAKTREMMSLRDGLVHNVAAGKAKDLKVDDSKTQPLPPVPTNYTASNSKNGTPEYKYGADAEAALTVPAGYKVQMFASEKEFPNLANPMQLSFDDKGRLWVAVMPTYPHYRPGDALPNDKILIYEDTDGDGKADQEKIWADHLHLPIGFEFAPEGVYLSQEPNLVLLSDTDGDDKADKTQVILGGFDTHDTHHAISAYTADPSGAFVMCEGVFLHTNVETAYGPVRCVDGGFYRYSPQRGMLERTAQLAIPNPWGAIFDQWGQDFFLHTSGTSMNWMLPVEVKPTFGSKTPSTPDLIPSAHKVRPTSGLEIVSSSHFPDEVQGDIILCNNIGFLGIKQHKIEDDGTGWKTDFRHDLLVSKDGNFRPVDLEFAPDGSLYVVDWHNVLIGHMQHNARDPLRDHVHGRIYRITYPSRPLVKSPQVAGAKVPALLENLKHSDMRVRYRTRRALRGHKAADVVPATVAWAGKLDKAEANYEHHRLEALWTTWAMNEADEGLLRDCLVSKDFHVRAAAVRVLRYNTHRVKDYGKLLEAAAADEHGRVRLEAVVAASWAPSVSVGKKVVATAAALPQDDWNKHAIKTAETRLAGAVEHEVPEDPVIPAPAHLNDVAKKQFLAGQQVYNREGLCKTCHQANGLGLDPAFPSLSKSDWVTKDKTLLIKVILNGLMGPMELGGKKYDGAVPMTPFGSMLSDDEIANVLTYVRNHFENKTDAVSAAEVKAVRAKFNKVGINTVEELLKEHPLK